MDQATILYAAGLILMGGLLFWLGRWQPARAPRDMAQQLVQAANIAQDLVHAAEQLWLTGELPKDDRLDYVLDELEALFPDLSERQLRATIESAVFWMKYGIQQLGKLEVDEVDWVPDGVSVNAGGLKIREVKHRGPES